MSSAVVFRLLSRMANRSETSTKPGQPDSRLISFRCLVLIVIVLPAEIVNAQYEQVNHWSWLTLVLLITLTSVLWVPLIIYCGLVFLRDPGRAQQGKPVIYFVAALFSLHALCMSSQTVSAIHAAGLVKAAEQFNATHGHCAATLKELGVREDFDHGQSVGHDGISYYDGAVFYPGPFPFSMNMYQCPGGPWTYQTD